MLSFVAKSIDESDILDRPIHTIPRPQLRAQSGRSPDSTLRSMYHGWTSDVEVRCREKLTGGMGQRLLARLPVGQCRETGVAGWR